jgi:molybdate transport system permease protein
MPRRKTVIRGVLGALFFLAIALTLGFVVLPVVGIFTHVPPGRLLHQFSNPVVTDALVISLKTVVASQIMVILLGTPTAYFLASRRFPGRPLLVTLVELPIVLPPTVAGLGLILAFGRIGLLGSTFDALGINVAFNQAAVVLAISFVAGPFYVRQGITSFEAVDGNLVAASRTLGAGPVRTFFKVILPLARDGLMTGEALCLARGLGEFGATIMFAGSLQGRTETLPLAIYTEFEAPNGLDISLAISALLITVSLAILIAMKSRGLWERSQPALIAIARPGPD